MMHPVRRQKLLLILLMLIGISIAAGLVLYALKQNINLFYTPTQIAAGEAPYNHDFRIGGMVEKGSLIHATDSLEIEFMITDNNHKTRVAYKGILPDLFREGQGIVAEGRLNAKGVFVAHEVLAKHDEKYMPPQAAKAMQANK